MISFVALALSVLLAPIEPAPQYISRDGGKFFELVSGTPIVVADRTPQGTLEAIGAFSQSVGLEFPVVKAGRFSGKGTAIYVGEAQGDGPLQARKVSRMISGMAAPGPQGYRLAITPRGVVVAGSDPAGTQYGLKTLERIAELGRPLPCLRIRDEPDFRLRGVYAEEPLSPARLGELAALKCNLVVYSSEDFYALEGEGALRWKRAFEDARMQGIEPVPFLDALSGAAAIVRKDPSAAEGRLATEHIQLRGTGWGELSQSNVLDTPSSRVQVTVSGIRCTPGQDYALEVGETAYPFAESNRAWRIRRVRDGAIPDGATVEVRYTYIPPGTTALCPHAPGRAKLMGAALDALVETLHPKYIHIGHGTVERINRDLRCILRNESNALCFTESVAALDGYAKSIDPDIRLMMRASAVNPFQDGVRYRLRGAARRLPKDVVLDLHLNDSSAEASLAWVTELGLDFIVSVGAGGRAAVYGACEGLRGDKTHALGFVAPAGAHDTVALVLEKAWSLGTPKLAWPQGLNAYFGVSLWEPKHGPIIGAMVNRLNRRTLDGVDPRTEYRAFLEVLGEVGEALPEEAFDGASLKRLYGHLTDYVEIEAAFAETQRESLLTRVARLVEAQARYRPEWDEARVQVIVDTIRRKGLFVPSGILFGEYVLPYRPQTAPSGSRILEIPISPEYEDEEHKVEAFVDLLAPSGPVCRVDFETVGAASVLLETSGDGREYTSLQHVTAQVQGGLRPQLRAPLLVDAPFVSRYLKLQVTSRSERAVLRDLRIFAFKGPPVAVSSVARSGLVVDGVLDEKVWDRVPDAYGFVAGNSFARTPTTVRLSHTRDALYIAARMHDRRPGTMVATQAGRDARLWEEESFEVRLDTGSGRVFRFALNPLGAQFESQDWDPGWNADWQAAARTDEGGWTAEIAIPFATLGVTPRRGTAWKVNFFRTRHNVTREESSWAPTPWGPDAPAFGIVRFE